MYSDIYSITNQTNMNRQVIFIVLLALTTGATLLTSCKKEVTIETPPLPDTAVLDSLVINGTANITKQIMYADDGGMTIEPKTYTGDRPNPPMSLLHTWSNKSLYCFTMEGLDENKTMFLLNFNKPGLFNGAANNPLKIYSGVYELFRNGSTYRLVRKVDAANNNVLAIYFH